MVLSKRLLDGLLLNPRSPFSRMGGWRCEVWTEVWSNFVQYLRKVSISRENLQRKTGVKVEVGSTVYDVPETRQRALLGACKIRQNETLDWRSVRRMKSRDCRVSTENRVRVSMSSAPFQV